MGARDHAIGHFDEMSRFAASLASLHGQVLEHSYTYTSLGSWTITFRYKSRLFRLSYDGRWQGHILERSPSRHSPHDWVTVWRHGSLNSGPPAGVIDRIIEAGDASG
jgi:hypothetical protein